MAAEFGSPEQQSANNPGQLSVDNRQRFGDPEQQGGVFSRRQALSGGYAASGIDARVRRGTWRALYPGVYTTAENQLDERGALWAALLYAGRGAVLSHQTAAWLHGFGAEPEVIHVTIPVERRVREPDGVRVHRSIWIAAADGDPPRTLAAETVLDLVNTSRSAADACAWAARAIEAGVTDQRTLLDAAAMRKKLRWRAELDRAALLAGQVSSVSPQQPC